MPSSSRVVDGTYNYATTRRASRRATPGSPALARARSEPCQLLLRQSPQTGSLTVIKRVVNDDNGNASSDDWTMNVAGPSASSFPGATDPGTTKTVDPGSYTVTESDGPSGYSLTYSGDCDANGGVSVAAGQSKTCILTNDDNEAPPPENGTITVQKELIPDGYQPPQGGLSSVARSTQSSATARARPSRSHLVPTR